MAWVGIFHGRPQEVVNNKPEGETSENYSWIEIDTEFMPYVNQDYIVEKEKVVPPSKDYFIAQLKADLASIRYTAQNYMVEYKNTTFLTNTDTDNAITAKIFDAQLSNDPDKYSVNFKGHSNYATLNLEDLKAIKKLISEHIQACFDREAEIVKYIDTSLSKEKTYKKILDGFLNTISVGWPLPEVTEGHY